VSINNSLQLSTTHSWTPIGLLINQSG